MAMWKAGITAVVIMALLVAVVPANGNVVTVSHIATKTGSAGPFAALSNSTSSLPSHSTQIARNGYLANVSVHGVWKSTGVNTARTIDGFISQNILNGTSGQSYLMVTGFRGQSNLSSLQISLSGSSLSQQVEINYSSGKTTATYIPVNFSRSEPLNFSISFKPGHITTKLIQYYSAFINLSVVTSGMTAGGGGIYIQDSVNIAITEQVYV